MDVAVGYNESFQIKVARFGDNMRNVGVTEGDKVEAQIQFGWTVDYFGIGDLVQVVDAVTDEEVDALFEEYSQLYDFDYSDYDKEEWARHVKAQAKQESVCAASLKQAAIRHLPRTLKTYMVCSSCLV